MPQTRILREFSDGFITPELAKRGDFGLSELSNGGLLNATQQEKFFEMLINYPALIGSVRRILMPSPQHEISKIGFGSRAFHIASSATALTSNQRSKPTTDKITLTSKKIMAQFNMPYEVFEDNIMKGTLESVLLKLFSQRLATDTEELALLGDPDSVDLDLAAFNGYLKRMTSHTVNATSTGVSEETFNAIITALPMKYRRDISAYRLYLTPNAKQKWALQVTSRQTGLGDAALQGKVGLSAMGVPIVGVPLMPSGRGMFTHPDNLLMGVHREIMMEADRDKEAQVIKFIFSARVDFSIEEEDMCVNVTNLGA